MMWYWSYKKNIVPMKIYPPIDNPCKQDRNWLVQFFRNKILTTSQVIWCIAGCLSGANRFTNFNLMEEKSSKPTFLDNPSCHTSACPVRGMGVRWICKCKGTHHTSSHYVKVFLLSFPRSWRHGSHAGDGWLQCRWWYKPYWWRQQNPSADDAPDIKLNASNNSQDNPNCWC